LKKNGALDISSVPAVGQTDIFAPQSLTPSIYQLWLENLRPIAVLSLMVSKMDAGSGTVLESNTNKFNYMIGCKYFYHGKQLF